MDNKTVCAVMRPIWDLEQVICGGNLQWEKEFARLIQESGKPVAQLTVGELMAIGQKADQHYSKLVEKGRI